MSMISIKEFKALVPGDLIKVSPYFEIFIFKSFGLTNVACYGKHVILCNFECCISHSQVYKIIMTCSILCKNCLVEMTCNKIEHSFKCYQNMKKEKYDN